MHLVCRACSIGQIYAPGPRTKADTPDMVIGRKSRPETRSFQCSFVRKLTTRPQWPQIILRKLNSILNPNQFNRQHPDHLRPTRSKVHVCYSSQPPARTHTNSPWILQIREYLERGNEPFHLS